MFSVLSAVALLGASVLPAVSAAPLAQPAGASLALSASTPTYTVAAATGTAGTFALADGFPSPSDAQVKQIELLAHGTLPNCPPPPTLSNEGLTSLQLIAFNENFEVAFFSSLIQNITNNVDGFRIDDKATRDFVLDALIAVLAQEELHALNAQGALKHFGKDMIVPCKYVFPTTNLDDAINLAATFGDVVLGTLQDVTQIFAQNGDFGLTRGVASVIGQEGEQAGFYRLLENKGKAPSALPFLTTSTRDFAFTALQGFIVPGSCPNGNEIPLKVFAPLTVKTADIKPADQTLQFSVDLKAVTGDHKPANADAFQSWAGQGFNGDVSRLDVSKLSLVYINQQNTPVAEKIQNVKLDGSVATFEATFPFTATQMNGLTIAAVTFGDKFASAADVAKAAIFAPGLIEIN